MATSCTRCRCVGALRARFPAPEIDWVVDGRHQARCVASSMCSRCVARRQDAQPARAAGARAGSAHVAALRAARYDVAFDVQGLIKSALLARASGRPRVIGWSRAAPARGRGRAVLHGARRCRSGAARHRQEPRPAARGRAARSVAASVALDVRRPSPRPSERGGGVRGPPLRGDQPRRELAQQALAARPLRRARARGIRAEHGLASVVSVGARGRGPGRRRGRRVARRGGARPEELAARHRAASRGAPRSWCRATPGPCTSPWPRARRMVGIFGPTDPRRNGSWHPPTCTCRAFEALRVPSSSGRAGPGRGASAT